jgi:hypothetical protein
MRNPKQPKPEMVLAYWPEGRGVEIFGNGRDYNGDIKGCASFNLAVRGILPDPDAWISSNSECDAMGDIILRAHINANDDGTPSASVTALYGSIYYADLPKIEARTKLLKRLNAAANKAQFYGGKGDPLTVLAQACEAYGIKRAIVYRSGKREREFAPLAVVLSHFAAAINARCAQIAGFQAREAA